MAPRDGCQHHFSRLLPGAMFDKKGREEKGKKILAVLSHFLGGNLEELVALDVGCSTGIIDNLLAPRFKILVGLDIDEEAVSYAEQEKKRENQHFLLTDAMTMPFHDQTFDVIICAHVYEHVPCASNLMKEIHRLLKPCGVCFFAAGNRLALMEPHYRLPLLSVVPKNLADLYVRRSGRALFYYEKHLTYWGLNKLTSKFRVIDYTMEIIANPEKFFAVDMCRPGSMTQRFALLLCRIAHWAMPGYIFVLQKT
jgi:SAM-dependent methyltransferase